MTGLLRLISSLASSLAVVLCIAALAMGSGAAMADEYLSGAECSGCTTVCPAGCDPATACTGTTKCDLGCNCIIGGGCKCQG